LAFPLFFFLSAPFPAAATVCHLAQRVDFRSRARACSQETTMRQQCSLVRPRTRSSELAGVSERASERIASIPSLLSASPSRRRPRGVFVGSQRPNGHVMESRNGPEMRAFLRCRSPARPRFLPGPFKTPLTAFQIKAKT